MVFIAELEFDPIILDEPLSAVPEMEITAIDRDYHDNQFRVIHWASGGDFDRFEAAVAEDPMIEDYRVLADQGDRRLQRVSYRVDPDESLYRIAVEHDVQLLESKLTVDRSIVRGRYPSREALEAVLDAFAERGFEVSVRRLYTNITDQTGDELTERQRETLTRAYGEGYFEIPHQTSLESIGEAMDISRQAVLSHLWRGLRKLVTKELDDVNKK